MQCRAIEACFVLEEIAFFFFSSQEAAVIVIDLIDF